MTHQDQDCNIKTVNIMGVEVRAGRPHFMIVRRAAIDLLSVHGSPHTLYGSPLLRQGKCYEYINTIYDDGTTFRDMELVLQYVFVTGMTSPDFPAQCDDAYTQKVVSFYSGRVVGTPLTFRGRKRIVDSMATANFLICRADHHGVVYGKHSGTDILKSARVMLHAMVAFLQELSDQDRLGI